MKEYKKFSISTIGAIIAVLLIFSFATYYIDPMLAYHDKSPMLTYYEYSKQDSPPGLARAYDYQTVLVGSSMTLPWDSRDIDEAFGTTTAKFQFNAATLKNIRAIMDVCFEEQPDLERVIISMDVFQSIEPYTEYNSPVSEFLYDMDTVEDHLSYLLNLDLFYHNTLLGLYGTIQGKTNEPHRFGAEKEVYNAERVLSEFKRADVENVTPVDTSLYIQNTYDNLEYNLLPLIENHPDTEFIFFIPPYSMLVWEGKLYDGRFDPMIDVLELLVETCICYDNVKIYSYIWDKEIITNLDNYRDEYHYSHDIAKVMTYDIAEGKDRLTKENYKAKMEEFRAYVKDFDYDTFWASYLK